jgi:hypothetical protein
MLEMKELQAKPVISFPATWISGTTGLVILLLNMWKVSPAVSEESAASNFKIDTLSLGSFHHEE